MTVIRLLKFGLRTLSFPGTIRVGSLWSQRNTPGREFAFDQAVRPGALTAVVGSILVSLDTDVLTKLLDLPPSLTDFLRYRLAGG